LVLSYHSSVLSIIIARWIQFLSSTFRAPMSETVGSQKFRVVRAKGQAITGTPLSACELPVHFLFWTATQNCSPVPIECVQLAE
jgi:hypothetical protein